MPTLCKPRLSELENELKGRKTWERGYAAGMIDSDGCISLYRGHKNIRGNDFVHYRLMVIVNQTDGRAIDFLYGTFGGNLYRRNAVGNRRPFLYRWELGGEKAQRFLKQILPMLRIKREQAELAIRFQDIRKSHTGCNQWTGKHDSNLYNELYHRLKNLKKIWLPSVAAETKWSNAERRSDSPCSKELNLETP